MEPLTSTTMMRALQEPSVRTTNVTLYIHWSFFQAWSLSIPFFRLHVSFKCRLLYVFNHIHKIGIKYRPGNILEQAIISGNSKTYESLYQTLLMHSWEWNILRVDAIPHTHTAYISKNCSRGIPGRGHESSLRIMSLTDSSTSAGGSYLSIAMTGFYMRLVILLFMCSVLTRICRSDVKEAHGIRPSRCIVRNRDAFPDMKYR